MSVADQLREEGRKAVAKNLLLKGYDLEAVAESKELGLVCT